MNEEGEVDDEVQVRDRGEELVRRRMKERRIAAGRQLSYYEGGYPAVTPPGVGGGTGHAADRRASRSRTRERDSVLSTSNQTQRDSSVEGYFSNPAQSPYLQPSLALSITGYEDSLRSRSEVGSVAGGDDDERYDDNDDANSAKHGSGSTVGAAGELQDPFEGSVAGSVLREPSGGAREEERMVDEDEDDVDLDHDEDEDDEDVELTLKDRQDVSNLSQ